MPLIKSKFRAAWWLPGAHMQTLWPSLVRRRKLPPVDRERVELEDGDFIDLVWCGPPKGPIVLFLHGLEGGLHSHYAAGMMQQLIQHGFRVCFMHFRGCSNEPNRLPISYHSGKTDDPQRIIEHIRSRQKREVFAALGISLGGNVLLKWLGEMAERHPLQRAAAISVPFELDQTAQRMQLGMSRLYQRHLIGSLQQSYRDKFARIPSPLDIDVDDLNTFHQFDDQVTAALNGFNGVDDYYQRCSCRQYIPHIRIPTLIVHARHDPFMFPQTAPTEAELPDNVWLEIPEQGGHVGFIRGWLPGWADYWAERRVAAWLAEEPDAVSLRTG